MATKKITLNELRKVIRQVIKEQVDIKSKVDEFSEKQKMGLRLYDVVYQLVDIINGEGDEDVIGYYPGWERKDFIELLTQMESRGIIDDSWREDVN